MHHYLHSGADTQDLESRTIPRITSICMQGHRSVWLASLRFGFWFPVSSFWFPHADSNFGLWAMFTFDFSYNVQGHCRLLLCTVATTHLLPICLSLSLSLSTCLSAHISPAHSHSSVTQIWACVPIYNRLFCQFHFLRSLDSTFCNHFILWPIVFGFVISAFSANSCYFI